MAKLKVSKLKYILRGFHDHLSSHNKPREDGYSFKVSYPVEVDPKCTTTYPGKVVAREVKVYLELGEWYVDL